MKPYKKQRKNKINPWKKAKKQNKKLKETKIIINLSSHFIKLNTILYLPKKTRLRQNYNKTNKKKKILTSNSSILAEIMLII